MRLEVALCLTEAPDSKKQALKWVRARTEASKASQFFLGVRLRWRRCCCRGWQRATFEVVTYWKCVTVYRHPTRLLKDFTAACGLWRWRRGTVLGEREVVAYVKHPTVDRCETRGLQNVVSDVLGRRRH